MDYSSSQLCFALHAMRLAQVGECGQPLLQFQLQATPRSPPTCASQIVPLGQLQCVRLMPTLWCRAVWSISLSLAPSLKQQPMHGADWPGQSCPTLRNCCKCPLVYWTPQHLLARTTSGQAPKLPPGITSPFCGLLPCPLLAAVSHLTETCP